MPYSRGSFQPRDRTRISFVSSTGRWIIYHWASCETFWSAPPIKKSPNPKVQSLSDGSFKKLLVGSSVNCWVMTDLGASLFEWWTEAFALETVANCGTIALWQEVSVPKGPTGSSHIPNDPVSLELFSLYREVHCRPSITRSELTGNEREFRGRLSISWLLIRMYSDSEKLPREVQVA